MLTITPQAMDMFNMGDGQESLVAGVGRVTCPVLVLGVTSDVLFPIDQQREMVALLKQAGMLVEWHALSQKKVLVAYSNSQGTYPGQPGDGHLLMLLYCRQYQSDLL